MRYTPSDLMTPRFPFRLANKVADVSPEVSKKWIARGVLAFSEASEEQGATRTETGYRLLSRLQVYELTIIQALVTLGIPPGRARDITAGFTVVGSDDRVAFGATFESGVTYLIATSNNRLGDVINVAEGGSLQKAIADWRDLTSSHAPALILLNISEIVARVDSILDLVPRYGD